MDAPDNFADRLAQRIREDARLIVLRLLADQPHETLHSTHILAELRRFGIRHDRDWLHDELQYLAARDAITITPAGSVLVATLTDKGERHLRRDIAINGVARPSRRGDAL
ncbi:MAG: hypothetical protein Q4G49_03130 [Paracoccus sp. (in: a-proteobacteria)]|nr:hypothetical protein [Paracoccus sp. (in: a-proteobacteria)]